MGMYTELNIGVALKPDTPKEIIDILEYMLGNTDIKPSVPDHPFFNTMRWSMLFVCDSYYFDGFTDSAMQFDDIDEMYHLNVRSNLKNYDDEIDKFLNFIQPYLDTKGFLGYRRYEEDETPTLIYNSYDCNKDIVYQMPRDYIEWGDI